MINKINGNSPIKNSQVILMSDFHYESNTQKYIRARIVDEVLQTTEKEYKQVAFLVEGAQSGQKVDDWIYETLIGEDLISHEHFVAGWDDLK